MHIESILVGAFGVNCFVLWGDDGKAVVVDPGAEPELLISALREKKLEIAAYWLTHGHIDHISALDGMLKMHPAPVFMHPEDSKWAFTPLNTFPPYDRCPAVPADLRPLANGQIIEAGGVQARVVHTPGHTPGCVCFHLESEQTLISGDTLFQGSVGRTDLPGGDFETLRKSLRVLTALDPATRVCPGHGPDTSIAIELSYNPFLRDL